MLNVCEAHDCVVVYANRDCPFCELQKEFNDLQIDMEKAQETIENLNNEKGE